MLLWLAARLPGFCSLMEQVIVSSSSLLMTSTKHVQAFPNQIFFVSESHFAIASEHLDLASQQPCLSARP